MQSQHEKLAQKPQSQVSQTKLPSTYFELIEKVGSNGPYQRNVFILFFINWFVTAVLLLQSAFLFFNREYECLAKGLIIQDCEDHICELPTEKERDLFLKEEEVKSLATEFGPYMCDELPELDLIKTIQYVGIFCGYLFFLYFSDNYGRKFSLLMTWGCNCLGVLLLVSAQGIEMAVIGLFLTGAGSETAVRINMSVMSEIVEYGQRQFYSVALEVSFGLGGCFIALMYFLIGQWRFFNILFVAIPSAIIMFFFFMYFEETPKFLMKKPRKQALRALNKIGKINKGRRDLITLEDIENVAEQNVEEDKFNNSINMIDLFRYKSLRAITIPTMIIFLSISYLYITPSFVVNKFGFNPYISLVVVALSELLAYPISLSYIKKMQRAKSGIICFLVSSAMSIILIVWEKPEDCNGSCFEAYLQLICVFIARFSIAFYFSIFFLFVNELYPLRARGIGFGIGSAAGAVGSMSGNVVIGYFYENHLNPQMLNLLLAIIAISALIFVPETLNKPLKDEIEEVLIEKNKVKEIKRSERSRRQSSGLE